MTIDPFNNRRSGYFFGLNPNGVRADGLYLNVTEFYAAWERSSRRSPAVSKAVGPPRFEIPFKSISFDPTTDTWGLNFSRGIVRKNENHRVGVAQPRLQPERRGHGGRLRGAGARRRARGRAVASASIAADVRDASRAGHTCRDRASRSESDAEPSLDLAYRLTPPLNASLTINTDFSATEVDDRQVNLTRLGLFFPEKRDFFLREADIFEFGGIGVAGHGFGITAAEHVRERPAVLLAAHRLERHGRGRGPRVRRQAQRPRR